VRFDRNRILSEDWMNYPILTMPDVPRVETVLINRPNERGARCRRGRARADGGRHRQCVRSPPTGRRIRELPLTPRAGEGRPGVAVDRRAVL